VCHTAIDFHSFSISEAVSINMRSHDEACEILLKIEELIKPLNKGPKVWSDHLAKVGTFEYVMVSDYLPFSFTLLHRACCFNYFFNIPTNAHTIYTLKSTKIYIKNT